jgi:junction plakoglobin
MDYELSPMSNSMNGHRSHARNGGTDGYIIQEHMNTQFNSTRAQRIRAAIFPEIIDNGISSTQFANGHSTAVQKLSEPSQLLKNAVIDIINYKEDADIAEKALPELIRLLSDDDPVVAGQAALILLTIAKKEASRLAMSTPQMIQALIQALSNPRANDEMRRGVAGVLNYLSQHKQGLLVIFKGGGIPLLIKLLE